MCFALHIDDKDLGMVEKSQVSSPSQMKHTYMMSVTRKQICSMLIGIRWGGFPGGGGAHMENVYPYPQWQKICATLPLPSVALQLGKMAPS